MKSNYSFYDEKKTGWKTPLIIESHLNGTRTKQHNPSVPTKHDEIAADAIRCWDAGATAIHAHNTSISLRGEAAYEDYMKTWRQVQEQRPEVFWYGTTCTPQILTAEESGLEHCALLAEREPDHVRLACVDPGVANIPILEDGNHHLMGIQYGYPLEKITKQVDLCQKHGIGIIWGIYSPEHLGVAKHYIRCGKSPTGSSIDFYFFGKYGLMAKQPINTMGVPPTLEGLYFYLEQIKDIDLPWFADVWGGGSEDLRPFMKRVIELGGHLKVGLEMHYDPNSNPTNLDLLLEAQALAREVGRPLATPAEAKAIYGLA